MNVRKTQLKRKCGISRGTPFLLTFDEPNKTIVLTFDEPNKTIVLRS